MPTAYTSLLGLALPVTGELSGTWGDTVNNAITSLLDSAVAGTTTLSTDADVTLTTTTGAANQARSAVIVWTATGTVTRNITAPAQSKAYVVVNATGGTQSIVIRGAGPTTGITVPAGRRVLVVWNGSDFVAVSGVQPRVSTATSTASITPNKNAFDMYALTAQAAALTINAPTGTLNDGDSLIFRILDNGVSQTITWNATYTVIGCVLPTTTTANKMVYVGCIYNAANTRWDVVAVTTQS